MIFCRLNLHGALFALQTSQICRVAAGEAVAFPANLAEIASLNRILGVIVPFFPVARPLLNLN
jgi:hypothetical protein